MGLRRYTIVCRYNCCPEHGSKRYYIVDAKTGMRTQQEFTTVKEAHTFLLKRLKRK